MKARHKIRKSRYEKKLSAARKLRRKASIKEIERKNRIAAKAALIDTVLLVSTSLVAVALFIAILCIIGYITHGSGQETSFEDNILRGLQLVMIIFLGVLLSVLGGVALLIIIVIGELACKFLIADPYNRFKEYRRQIKEERLYNILRMHE